jgi:hypothetical protein
MFDLSLRYEENGTAHDDLVLRFAGQTRVCDTYYFALDRSLRAEDESPDKVRAILRKLLEQWLIAATNLPDAGTAFLPYDFSDQYTGWLCCHRKGDKVAVSLGWDEVVQGWSIFPSAIGEHVSRLPSFKADGPAIELSRDDLLQAIRDSLIQAA